MIKILGISGSLRKVSSNSAMLTAASVLAEKKGTVQINVYPPEDLEKIPNFNPDRETMGDIPQSVMDFRNAIAACQGIIIASPEYMGGIPGALKNAFDWMIGSFGLDIYQKHFALLNISNRATKAHEDWKIITKTMGGNLILPATLHIPLPGNTLTLDSILKNPKLTESLGKMIDELALAITSFDN